MSESKLQDTSTPNAAGRSLLNRWTKGPKAARDRIHRGVVIPEWQPSFQIAPDAQVFAIGSCFARNIETELLKLGVQVTSADPKSEVMEIRTNLQLGLLNKYNPASIHQELAWAADHTPFPEQGFVDSQGKYSDPYLRQQTPGGDLGQMQARREALKQYFAQAFKADLVIVTLGLTETWYDRHTKLALTEVPSPRLLKDHPDRFGFKQLFFADCITLLKSICALLRTYGKPDLKMVFTLSPVALQRTFTGQDVIVANLMSKSTLRSAVGELTAKMVGVDYFPSYEAVSLSDPLVAWQGDRRNVTEWIVASIMGEFTRRYGLRPPLDSEQVKAQERQILQTRLSMAQQSIATLSHLLNPAEKP